MSQHTMRYIGLVSGHADGTEPRVQVATPSGVIREAPLTRADLLRIIRSAAGALDYLDRREARR